MTADLDNRLRPTPPPAPDAHFVRLFGSLSEIAAWLAVAIGAAGLIGWLLKSAPLTQPIPSLASIKPNAALAFVMAGMALWLVRTEQAQTSRRLWSRALATIVLLIGLLTLVEYITGLSLGVDELPLPDPEPLLNPGRMSANAALAFAGAGLAILLLSGAAALDRQAAQWLALLVMGISLVAVVGYLFGVTGWYGSNGALTGTSPQSSVAFLALSIGVLFARSEAGLMPVLVSAGAGGEMARRLLVSAVLVPLGIGALVAAGLAAQLYDASLSAAIYTVLAMVVFTALIGATSASLDRVDARRAEAEAQRATALQELTRAHAELEQHVQERTAQLASANAALLANEGALRRQANLLNLTHDAIMVRDLDATLRFWNHGAEARYGWREDEVLGQRSHTLLQTVFPAPLEQIRAELMERGHWEGELVHTTRDGWQITVLARWALARDEAGNPTGVLETNTDITARKQAERELQRLYEQLEQQARTLDEILSASPDHFYMYDAAGRYLYVNRAAAAALGLNREVMLGRTGRELGFPSKLMDRMDAEREQVLATGRSVTGETPFAVVDGERYYDYVFSPIHDNAGAVTSVVGTVRDITQRKAVEQEIRRLNAELEQRVAQRTAQLAASVKELESFSYSVSHDLRAPLRAIDGFSRILLEDYAAQLAPEAREYLDLVRANTQQMGRLIDDLLAFSRTGRQSVQRRPVDMSELVQQAIEQLRPEQEGRQVEFILDELPICRADPGLLRQVFVNLLSNALKFTRTRPVARIQVGSRRDGDEPVFFVRDNGVGFDMRYVNKIFGVFQRLHASEEYEGTGVGLALVQRIIQRHDGRIWAEAEVDRGATFYFTLGEDNDDDGSD